LLAAIAGGDRPGPVVGRRFAAPRFRLGAFTLTSGSGFPEEDGGGVAPGLSLDFGGSETGAVASWPRPAIGKNTPTASIAANGNAAPARRRTETDMMGLFKIGARMRALKLTKDG